MRNFLLILICILCTSCMYDRYDEDTSNQMVNPKNLIQPDDVLSQPKFVHPDRRVISVDKDCEPFWNTRIGQYDHSVTKVEYDGHRYIFFNEGYRMGVVHDPDCPCHNKE